MKKLLNYKTLMTILAMIVVVLQLLINVFKLNLNVDLVVSISIGLISALVTIGVVKKDKNDKEIKSKEDLENLLKEEETNSEKLKKEEKKPTNDEI